MSVILKRACAIPLRRSFAFFHCKRLNRSTFSIALPSDRVLKTQIRVRPFATASEVQESHKAERHEFQAETRQLLDIVARSLYSEKEVFVRELISNASDALEKLRYKISSGEAEKNKWPALSRPLEIHIETNKQDRTLIIRDSGIGMSKEELMSNLGVIARSGSKAFLDELKTKRTEETDARNIIGQFGVGFYSAFMVADNVEVYTRAADQGQGWKWSSDGTGTYEIQPVDDLDFGTKIVIHLKGDCREFADDDTVLKVIQRYSNFVGSPIILNGKRANSVQPLWLTDAKTITAEQHTEFYRYVANAHDTPRYTLHYHVDVPLAIHALLYFPTRAPSLFEMSRETEMGVALYAKKILIKSHADNILPKWLRFVKGVVDSEDIPLNLSRELFQNSSLIRKLRDVLTARCIKFLVEQVKKDANAYDQFYTDYGIFLKEGIVTNESQSEKEEIAKLLRFESSHLPPGQKLGLTEYISRIRDEQKTIFYIAAPSRNLAESSPYYESLKKKQQEVLFCYEPYDELVLLQLQQFNNYRLVSVEKDMREDKATINDLTDLGDDSLKRSEINELTKWLEEKLKGKVFAVKATTRLEAHPCVITVEEMASARHLIKTHGHQLSEEQRLHILRPQLELNPRHPLVKKLFSLMSTDAELGELLAKQLYGNAMLGADLIENPRTILTSMNELLTRAFSQR